MWTESTIRQWLAIILAPAQVHRLFAKHKLQQTLTAEVREPLGNLSRFWRKQLPEVPPKLVSQTRKWLDEDDNNFVISRGCETYPEYLINIDSPPWLLFGSGKRELLQSPQLAIVGSRRASPYGLSNAVQLSKELSRHGWTITSGMALGIDAAAHRAALEQGGTTVAVLGCGPDICYPPRARELYAEIRTKGVVISEFIPGTSARSDHFLRRNRIISGLCQGVVVAEAGIRSGSLVTAKLALEQNRSVFAMPGPVTQSSYRGNHRLIQQGAFLVTCAQDILTDLPVLETQRVETANENPEQPLTGGLANHQMLDNVGYETTSIDSLVERTRLPVAMVMNQLISLELDGWVTAVPGGYVRVRRK